MSARVTEDYCWYGSPAIDEREVLMCTPEHFAFEVDKEGRVDIVFDKKQYRPGEKAKVLFLCPFAGRLLVTVERNGVLHQEARHRRQVQECDGHCRRIVCPPVFSENKNVQARTDFNCRLTCLAIV